MKITILGAGVAASNYNPDKKLNEWPPAFLVEWSGGNLLFECSQAVHERIEKTGFDSTLIHDVAISHPHPDHCAPIHYIQSIFCKGYFSGGKFVNKDLAFYGPDPLIENFPKLWNIYIPDRESLDYPKLRLVPVSDGKGAYLVGKDGSLSGRSVYHAFGKCPAVAYRLETPEGIVAYSGDTGDCPGVREVAKGASVFICEASAPISDNASPRDYGHLNPQTIGKIATEAGVKKIILFHYTGADSDEEMIGEIMKAGFTGEVIAGKDFEVMNV